MSYKHIYAIGDVQGCFLELQALLELIAFRPETDQLWFTGDLVNRGPHSLEVLRFIRGLRKNAVSVLGNHDLHLLSVYYGTQSLSPQDTFEDVLNAPDAEELMRWLVQLPFIYHDPVLKDTLVHAGIPPQWTLSEALQYGQELSEALQADPINFLSELYGEEPRQWQPTLQGKNRHRYLTNAFTRMRFCTEIGELNLRLKESAISPDPHLMPWFLVPERGTLEDPIIFGHWAALQGRTNTPKVYAIDTGCAWGNTLTAMRLADRKRFSVPAQTR